MPFLRTDAPMITREDEIRRRNTDLWRYRYYAVCLTQTVRRAGDVEAPTISQLSTTHSAKHTEARGRLCIYGPSGIGLMASIIQ